MAALELQNFRTEAILLAMSSSWENRVPIGVAVLVSMVALLAMLSFAPASTSGPIQMTISQEQLLTGSGRGMGAFWLTVGVGGVILGAVVLAPILPAVFAGTATVAVTVKALGALGTMAAGFSAINSGANEFSR